MAFIHKKGKTRLEWLPVTVSTTLPANALTEWTSGYIAEADDNDILLAGVTVRAIAATDSDYATARLIALRIPVEKHVVWEADSSDTFVQASHGGIQCGIDASTTVDLDDTTNLVFQVIGGSGTKILGYLNFNSGKY